MNFDAFIKEKRPIMEDLIEDKPPVTLSVNHHNLFRKSKKQKGDAFIQASHS
nr:hypothetical protein [Ectobacillus panaciterrae]